MLAPIMPLLGWGTLTHSYLNYRTLHHIDNLTSDSKSRISDFFSIAENRENFINLAGYPDIIKAKGFLKGDTSYDYAHNPLPNRYYGQPEFAIQLFNRFISTKNDFLLSFALSWRAHQITDIFAHHMPLKKSYGFANSENFFGPFWSKVVDHIGEEKSRNLSGSFYRADHWTTELIVDLFCYLKMGADWSGRFLQDAPPQPISQINQISADYLEHYKEKLDSEYPLVMPVRISEIKRGKEFSDTLNFTTKRYFDSLIRKRSAKTVMAMITEHDTFDNLEATLDNVGYACARAMLEPQSGWKAPTYNERLFLGGGTVDEIFPGYVDEKDYGNYYSKDLEEEYKKFQPKREGIVKFVLEKIQFAPVRFIVAATPLVTSGNFINRALLPSGWSSYSLSLRFAFNLRERNEKNLVEILRKTLEEVDIIS